MPPSSATPVIALLPFNLAEQLLSSVQRVLLIGKIDEEREAKPNMVLNQETVIMRFVF